MYTLSFNSLVHLNFSWNAWTLNFRLRGSQCYFSFDSFLVSNYCFNHQHVIMILSISASQQENHYHVYKAIENYYDFFYF